MFNTQEQTAHLNSRTAHGVGAFRFVTGDFTVLLSDAVIICDSASAVNATLPPGQYGRWYAIKNIGSGVVNVTCEDQGETIEGEDEQEVQTGDYMKVQYIDEEYRFI